MNSRYYDQKNMNNLLRIQKTRLLADEKILNQAQRSYLQAESVLKEREINIQSIKKIIENTYNYMTFKSSRYFSERINRGYEYLYWLNYDLEMHEYYLTLEEERVNEAKNEYILAKKKWYKQKIKLEKIKEKTLQINQIISVEKEVNEVESIYELGLSKGTNYYG